MLSSTFDCILLTLFAIRGLFFTSILDEIRNNLHDNFQYFSWEAMPTAENRRLIFIVVAVWFVVLYQTNLYRLILGVFIIFYPPP